MRLVVTLGLLVLSGAAVAAQSHAPSPPAHGAETKGASPASNVDPTKATHTPPPTTARQGGELTLPAKKPAAPGPHGGKATAAHPVSAGKAPTEPAPTAQQTPAATTDTAARLAALRQRVAALKASPPKPRPRATAAPRPRVDVRWPEERMTLTWPPQEDRILVSWPR